MLVLEVQGQLKNTVFIKLFEIYPECQHLIKDEERLFPLRCFYDDGCHRGQNCQEKMAHRVKYIFDAWPDADLCVLYFSYRDRPGSQRGVTFWRDMRAPEYITFNRTGWEKFKDLGTVYEWAGLPDRFFLNPTGIIQIGK